MNKVILGSNDTTRPGWATLDQCQPADIIHDLRYRWPFEDGSVEAFEAHDVAEHIDSPEYPGNKGKIWFFNEAYRCLKSGGILDLIVPTVKGFGAFQDPTHVSFWTPNDKWYFCAERDPITHLYKIWDERVRFGCDPKLDYDALGVIKPLQNFGGHYGIHGLFGIPTDNDWRHKNYHTDPASGEQAWKVFAKLIALK